MKLKIQESNSRLGNTVDNELDEGLGLIIQKHAPTILRANTLKILFHYLFWEQQAENMQRTPCQRRWHPMLIRWCLHLHMLSASAYDAIKHVLVYQVKEHFVTTQITSNLVFGIQNEVTMQLMKEASINTSAEIHCNCI